MNPYEALGIKPSATAKEIKTAHRKMAIKHHPDRGGDRDKFEAVQKAYECLSDPERRAHFDRTGEMRDEARDATIEILMTTLSVLFNQVVQAIAAERKPVENCLFIDSLHNAIDATLQKIAESRPGNAAALKMYEKMLGRFSVAGDKPNHLETILRSQIEGVKTHSALLDSEEQRFKMAKQYLADCRYRTDPMDVMASIMGGVGTIAILG